MKCAPPIDLLRRFVLPTICLALIGLAGQTAWGQTFPELIVESEADIRSDDLIRLTDSYAEAAQLYRTAALRLKTLRVIGGNSNLTGLEVQIAQIDMSVAESRIQIMQAIAEKVQDIALARVEFFRRLERESGQAAAAGALNNPQLRQAEADLRIIKMILAMNPVPPVTVENQP